jgi:hypothetical protein
MGQGIRWRKEKRGDVLILGLSEGGVREIGGCTDEGQASDTEIICKKDAGEYVCKDM